MARSCALPDAPGGGDWRTDAKTAAFQVKRSKGFEGMARPRRQ